jgi:pimeloyl-ACP methyl ester carboxylesterase
VRPFSLTEWRQAGGRVRLQAAGRAVSVFRRLAGPSGADVWTLLHGWPTTSWDWAAVAPAIETRYRTLAMDWPGLGASDKGMGVDYSIDALADTVVALWKHHGITRASLVAHDVGTIVAQELLARHLEGKIGVAIDAVMWLNGSIYPELYRPTDTQLALLDPATGPQLSSLIDANSYMAGIASVHHADHQPNATTLEGHWEAFGGRQSTPEMTRFLQYIPDRAARATRLVNAIETTAVPQRFIWGDADPVSGKAQSERIRERFGNDVDLVTFADCSHYPHTERPADVARELLRPW